MLVKTRLIYVGDRFNTGVSNMGYQGAYILKSTRLERAQTIKQSV